MNKAGSRLNLVKADYVNFAFNDLLSFCRIFVECRKKILANVTWAKVEVGGNESS